MSELLRASGTVLLADLCLSCLATASHLSAATIKQMCEQVSGSATYTGIAEGSMMTQNLWVWLQHV